LWGLLGAVLRKMAVEPVDGRKKRVVEEAIINNIV
jgi:hypothetical protein